MRKFSNMTSPAHWEFQDPDVPHKYYRAPNQNTLYALIKNYRLQNGLEPIEQLQLVVENYLCGKKENAGKCIDARLERGWTSIVTGGIALLKQYYYGDKHMVTDEEAEARAQICLTCPHNIMPEKAIDVYWQDELAEMSTKGRRTSVHEKLGNCGCCGCPLRAKVFHKAKFELSERELECIIPECWQRANYEKVEK